MTDCQSRERCVSGHNILYYRYIDLTRHALNLGFAKQATTWGYSLKSKHLEHYSQSHKFDNNLTAK